MRPDHGEVRYWGGTAWPGRTNLKLTSGRLCMDFAADRCLDSAGVFAIDCDLNGFGGTAATVPER